MFCPASTNCLVSQRTGLILKSVSNVFHEKALKVLEGRSRYPLNLGTFAKYSLIGVHAPDFEQNLKVSPLERGSPSKSTEKINDNLSSDKSNADFRKNSASAKPAPDTQEKIDPRVQPGLLTANGPTASKPGLYPAFPDLKYASLFESVVNPAIAKSKNRYNDRLPEEVLDTIGKDVSCHYIEMGKKVPS